MSPSYVFNQDQLNSKLNRMHREWRLMNDVLNKGTGKDAKRDIITDEAGRLEELYWMFARNTTTRGMGRSSTHLSRTPIVAGSGEDEPMMGTNSGSCWSREEYEDITLSQSPLMPETDDYFSTPRHRPLHPRLGKIDRTGPKATESIEWCVDELTKFKDLRTLSSPWYWSVSIVIVLERSSSVWMMGTNCDGCTH
ncbi:hypothetical protein Salat_2727800 [Sesamum alatum]|uniref:Uncharacterized protein n=1 Tax=Sesamum alatum TaxID=300844 RepID=A0AAE1XJV6_9LAMI|nr:hypothetical protein Salat_2727800 [Sesamum alatum]